MLVTVITEREEISMPVSVTIPGADEYGPSLARASV